MTPSTITAANTVTTKSEGGGVAGTMNVELSDAELAERRKSWKPKSPSFGSGALWRFAQNVGPARAGAVTHPGAAKEVRTYADI